MHVSERVSESEGLSPAKCSRGNPKRPVSAEAPVYGLAPPPIGLEQVQSEAAQPCGSRRQWEPSPTDLKETPWDSQCACTAPSLTETDHMIESPEEDAGREESTAGAQWWIHIGMHQRQPWPRAFTHPVPTHTHMHSHTALA